eukprot:4924083-Amphidinium_carterae.1
MSAHIRSRRKKASTSNFFKAALVLVTFNLKWVASTVPGPVFKAFLPDLQAQLFLPANARSLALANQCPWAQPH